MSGSRRAELDALIAVMADAVELDGGELRLVDVDESSGVVHVELSAALGRGGYRPAR